MEYIPLPVAPIDVVQVEALGIAFDGLLQSRSQGDEVVNRFVSLEQAVVFDVFKLLDGRLDVLLAEEEFPPFVVNAVKPLELVTEDAFQQDVPGLSQTGGERLRGDRYSKPRLIRSCSAGIWERYFSLNRKPFINLLLRIAKAA